MTKGRIKYIMLYLLIENQVLEDTQTWNPNDKSPWPLTLRKCFWVSIVQYKQRDDKVKGEWTDWNWTDHSVKYRLSGNKLWLSTEIKEQTFARSVIIKEHTTKAWVLTELCLMLAVTFTFALWTVGVLTAVFLAEYFVDNIRHVECSSYSWARKRGKMWNRLKNMEDFFHSCTHDDKFAEKMCKKLIIPNK